MIFLMTHETGPENANTKETLETRTTDLAKALDTTAPPILEFARLYTGDSLNAIKPYGGDLVIFDAFNRLRNFVAVFRSEIDTKVQKVSPEVLERAEVSFAILNGAHQGAGLEETEKKAADLIAKDALRRAKAIKEAGLLDDDTKGTMNYLYTQIRLLIDEGKIDGHKPADLEDRFPLAFTMSKVLEIEKLMALALEKNTGEAGNQIDSGRKAREIQQRIQSRARKRR